MRFNINRCVEYKDQYNIYNLITKINRGYRLYFDLYDKLFKIINIANNNEICLKIDKLSSNILKTLQIFKINNINKIVKDIERHNDFVLSKSEQNLKDNMISKMTETLNLSKRATSISRYDINKILGEKAW